MADENMREPRQIVTREHAKAEGLKHYFTGEPCKRGHISNRYVVSRRCAICDAESRDYWRGDNRNKERERDHIRYMNNIKERPECRRDRYNRNSECDKARLRRAEDPEKMRKSTAASLRWQKENREAALVIKRNRRARKIAADGNHSASDIAAIRAVQKDRCACCRKKLDLKGHVDHIHPLARGGSNWPRNLQLLCERCNCAKSARDPIEFMRSQGFLI